MFMHKLNRLWVLLAFWLFEPVQAHVGHGVEYSVGYVLLLVSLFLLLIKLYKNN